MQKKKNILNLCLYFFMFSTFMKAAAGVVINEFAAINDTTYADENGDYSDWIELKNDSSDTVDLTGWHLSDDADDLDKWRFPATNILPGAYMVIFASDKDRTVSGRELHTNFKLSGDGEYLGLVKSDGKSVEHEYSPEFPAQIADQSYGIADNAVVDTLLVQEGTPCFVLAPSDNSWGTNWLYPLAAFNESSWISGTPGIGYERSSGYKSLINTDMESEMYELQATVYIRIPFNITDIGEIMDLTLRMKCDDGFIAYLNGVQVASLNAPSTPAWDSMSTAIRPDSEAINFEEYDISAYKNALQEGNNILAIHGLNRSLTSSDMLIVPELECTTPGDVSEEKIGYLKEATPGAENTDVVDPVSAPVSISVPGSLCSTSVILEITADDPVEKIYYTLDGSEPSTASLEYTGALTITATTCVRARSFSPGFVLGPVSSETYLFFDSSVTSFSSDLPILVVDNLGGGNIPDTSKQPAFMAFFEPGNDGRTYMTNNFTLSSRAGIRRRGESSLRPTTDKPNLAIETWSQGVNDDFNIKPLGMPSESDWILWAPWHFDPAGLRNAFIYDISNQTGNYAVRTRFVEVFLNTYGGNVTMNDYVGMYVFMEKIKRDNNRVDVQQMTPFDNTEPAVTGGYILRIDKDDPDGNELDGMVQPKMWCRDPQADEITPQQEAWISDFIIDFEAQLNNTNEITGYPSYIDQDAFVDHNIFNMLTKNADGLRLSTYMYKPRNGKLAMGPIWDFDRSMDSTDGRDNNPLEWAGRDYCYIEGTDSAYWWKHLFKNADFWQKYIDRWQELRMNVLSDINVTATIDTMAAKIAEVKVRDIARWQGVDSYTSPRFGSNGLDGTQQGEVNYLKWWLTTRMNWIDDQLISPPLLSHEGGRISEPVQLTISIPAGTTVYYTTDGSDPRAPGGAPSSKAVAYTSAITVNPDTLVRARAWDGTAWQGNAPTEAPWSSVSEAVFMRSSPGMYLSEVHYNPALPATLSPYDNEDYEFIEFHNVCGENMDLRGYELDGEVEFAFSKGKIQTLAAGAYLVVVRNLDAFSSRYSTNGMFIAGEYSGKLSNSGADIRLEFYKQKVYEIAYNDSRGWPCAADGGGPSLIPDNSALEIQGFDILDYPGNWRPSTYIGGSPGDADPEPPEEGILINEITAHTDTDEDPPFDSNDQIELYNPTGSPIVFDSNWYLSDNLDKPQKWNIPAGTTLPAKGWVLFDEDDFHPDRVNGFGLDKTGELLVLSYRPDSNQDRVIDCVQFKGQPNGSSLGRYPDGNLYFQKLPPTPGYANQPPLPGIRIQELMYNPQPVEGINEDNILEYIMLTNASSSIILLTGLQNCTNTWRFNGGIEYVFEEEISVNAGERLWIVPFDPLTEPDSKSLFCSTYELDPASTHLLGPYNGNLSNSGERIALEQPQSSDDPLAPEEISWIIIDEIIWLDEFPWPAGADGTGLALLRKGNAGNDPLSWTLSEYSGLKHIITSEKLSPGVSTWDGFSLVPSPSCTDYADINTGNGSVMNVAMGSFMFLNGGPEKLNNGIFQINGLDIGNASVFLWNTPGRWQLDFQNIIPIKEINTFSWHNDVFQNQHYNLYYSQANTAPAADESVTNPSDAGWILFDRVQTTFDTSTIGQIGVSIRNRFNDTLIYAKHLLWDIKTQNAFYSEFDVFMNGSFVTNNVPSVWLNSHALTATDTAAMTDSDGDGLLNWEEFYAGTDPNSISSVFKITKNTKSSSQHTLRWKAVAGKTYAIQFKTTLTSPEWTTIRSGISGTEPECTCSLELTDSNGFIRIVVE